MKKTLFILACALTLGSAMPIFSQVAAFSDRAYKGETRNADPLTKQLLIGNWEVQGQDMQTTFSFGADGKLNTTMSQTNSEDGITVTMKIFINNIDWSVADGKLLLEFDDATIDFDLVLPPMLEPYKDAFRKEFDGQKDALLNEAKEMGVKPIDVVVVDNDTLRVKLSEDEDPNIFVRIKDAE